MHVVVVEVGAVCELREPELQYDVWHRPSGVHFLVYTAATEAYCNNKAARYAAARAASIEPG